MSQEKNKNKEPEKQNRKAETEENYGFIKEERVPLGKWQKRRKYLRSFFLVIGVAVLFGVIARCSYGISDYVIQHFFTKDERETVNLRPTPTVAMELGGKVQPIVDDKAFESFESIIKGVQTASEALEPYLVTVSYVKDVVDPVFSDITESITNVSGVIIGDNGTAYVIYTPYSLAESLDYDHVRVTFFGGRKADGEVYASSQEADVFLISVKYKEFTGQEKETLKPLAFGKSNELSLGSAVIALGYPDGHGTSANMGFITSRAKKVYISDLSLEILETNILGARGESGILVNTKGELVGFITNRFRDDGCCIEAISCDKIRPLLNFLANDMKYPKFGAHFQDISDDVLSSMSLQNGIIIEKVDEDSVAASQMFRQGDIITHLSGAAVTSVEEFFSIYTSYHKGEDIEVTFYRNGKEMKKSFKISF